MKVVIIDKQTNLKEVNNHNIHEYDYKISE